MNFTLQSMIDALNTLAIGTVYKYASVERASTGSCELVSVDQHTGAIKYKRNRVGTAPEANTKIESITGANVAKLATALNSQIYLFVKLTARSISSGIPTIHTLSDKLLLRMHRWFMFQQLKMITPVLILIISHANSSSMVRRGRGSRGG